MVSVRQTEAPQSQYHTCVGRVATGQAANLPPSNLRSPAAGHGPPAMAMKKGTFWPQGSHIKVGFMGDTATSKDATDFVKAKVQEKAKIWETYANIVFDFVDMSENPAIRVSFGPDGGSWSYIGTECKGIDASQPTMNYGWFNDQTEDDEFERVAVHEFGHALGCTHELQSPSADAIVWNRQAVYDYYQRTNGWSTQEVDAQVLTPDNPNDDIDSMFDPTSIMCYPIPAGLANIVVGWNKHLSPMDEDFIASVYPKQTNDAGSFSTDDLEKKLPPNNVNALQVSFTRPYKTEPKFAYGLSGVDMSGAYNLRLAARIDEVNRESFKVHADTWNDSQLTAASVAWMEVIDPTKHQVGVFDTKEYASPETPLSTVTEHVQFPKAFSATPVVFLFLKGFDLSKDHPWTIATAASNISQSGFDVTVKAQGNTQCFGAQVTWIAFPAYLPAICGGAVVAGAGQESGQVTFPKGKFAAGAPPSRVMLTLNGFDVENGQDMKIKTYADGITEEGFTWHAESWGGSSFSGALSWVAS
ncbi:uncharacterized protein PV07_01396 [Cladophialophora immunda]|uniref:Peptidase metallopeptidase domain-containing protein n=1 Tax=Cladophialophora immunda TaxID=569365 RepID=A0A0D2A2W9_9EURO|nr:uncharacterized protein PV07_01396 [Cladophialophora immunda]KIW34626.1 hypothetical protein PV07_01396 [Cladophialophora immunda]